MFFQRKIDATMDGIKNKNIGEDIEIEENEIELERKDILALCLSAFLVFSPVLIILILLLVWSFNI